MKTPNLPPLLLAFLIGTLFAHADSTVNGQRGFIQMPDARTGEEGSWRMGFAVQSPYRALWTSASLMPWLEVSARFTRISDVEGFANNSQYGDYGDKAFAAKLQLLDERYWQPALAVGIDDFEGTGLFSSHYVVASKQIGDADLSIGYGRKRTQGVFGGVRYPIPGLAGLKLVAEYDANQYASDLAAKESGADKRKQGLNLGLAYQYGWLNGQVGRMRDGTMTANAYVDIPLNKKEFIPKLDEPAALEKLPVRPTEQAWLEDGQYQRHLLRALQRQQYRDIRCSYRAATLDIELANTRIALPSRAAGRAARIALAHAPFGVREISITLKQGGLPVTQYRFNDTDALARYFNGALSREDLARSVTIKQASANEPDSPETSVEQIAQWDEPNYSADLEAGQSTGEIAALSVRDRGLSQLRVAPKLGAYFNDPSGVLKYDLYLQASLNARLAQRTFLDLSATASVLENVSSVTQDSNSALPHVRSDVAQYKRDSKAALERAAISQYFHLGQGWYGRTSAGLYEEMFGGIGGQVLYQPSRAPYTLDLTLDRVRQRDTGGGLKFRDYEATTAIASLHYRIPSQGLTTTLRAGRFLAGDEGVRAEVAKRFRSGVEMGAWYTVTNGNDITSPGSPTSPYHDKGVFLSIPLNVLLTKDTAAVGRYSLAPWTRDVGQIVAYPGDLYGIVSRYLTNREDRDGLVELDDLDDDYRMPVPQTLFYRQPIHDQAKMLWSGLGDTASRSGISKLAYAGGAIWLASRFDSRLDRSSAKSTPSKSTQKVIDAGDALPWAGLALSGALATYEGNNRLSRTAYSAFQAGISAGVLAEAGKWAFGRTRPKANAGDSLEGFDRRQSRHSLPSSHVAVATAVVTPFAQEYAMPALYALPAITQYGRMRSREHWFSDVVAGSLLGIAAGQYSWDWNRKRSKLEPEVQIGTRSISLRWEVQ
ncbi:YjbH domain-containing protein [Chitinimonas taiwanensis]|uniref:YjbH domain-containing protein n=1 Tax=Chitinimonas taiwanensis TaxID=240412 RepID=UPI0035B4C2C8